MKAIPPCSAQPIHRGKKLGAVLIGIGVLELVALGMIHAAISWKQRLPELQNGETAPTTVKTPVAFTVEDVRATMHLRQAAAGPGVEPTRILADDKKDNVHRSSLRGRCQKQAPILPVKSVQSMAAAKQQFFESMAGHEDEWRTFAGAFLKPNLLFSEQLTTSMRHDATAALAVRREYKAGDDIVMAGVAVSETQSAALATLGEHYATLNSERTSMNMWLLLLGAAGVSAGLVIRLMKPGADVSSVVVASGETGRPGMDADHLKGGLLNQMSLWLKEQFVVRLIDRINEAIDHQAGASSKIEQINNRLNKLQPEIWERIATYEQRIEDLEKELLESTAMKKELIQSKILTVRKELEIEKAKSKAVWN